MSDEEVLGPIMEQLVAYLRRSAPPAAAPAGAPALTLASTKLSAAPLTAEAAKAVDKAAAKAGKKLDAADAKAKAATDAKAKGSSTDEDVPRTGVPAGATTARTLADFANVDRSLVYPRGAAPTIDHVTQVSPGVFNFLLRHRGAWYDGDRDLEWNYKGHPKSRAEVFLKQPKIKVGETWEFGTTVRLDPDFVPSEQYCNLAQPVFSLGFFTLTDQKGDAVTGEYYFNENPDAIGQKLRLVRSVTFRRARWTSLVFRIRFDKKGSMTMSLNGDAHAGLAGIDTSRPKKFNYKVGLYGTGLKDVHGKQLRDSQLQHRDIYMVRVA